jgi:hypothetical protein
MGIKTRFTTPVDRMLRIFSGWSEEKCRTCKRVMTEAQLSYSMRFFNKPLCRRCQTLEKYGANHGGLDG